MSANVKRPVDLPPSICTNRIQRTNRSRFSRVRKYFAILGGTAIAVSAAVVVLTAPAPASPINVCALLPSMDACQPPDVRKSMFVHKTNPPTITQVSPSSGY